MVKFMICYRLNIQILILEEIKLKLILQSGATGKAVLLLSMKDEKN